MNVTTLVVVGLNAVLPGDIELLDWSLFVPVGFHRSGARIPLKTVRVVLLYGEMSSEEVTSLLDWAETHRLQHRTVEGPILLRNLLESYRNLKAPVPIAERYQGSQKKNVAHQAKKQ